jgi:light-regulated signal transduction histidine kinase (bacteriophytochrome)
VDFKIERGVVVQADSGLMLILLENLLGNAFKFSSKNPAAKIEFGSFRENEKPVFFVRDNGAGFDMKYSNKLFGIFQRMHSEREFSGTGVGLATVKRIILRHDGKIWAESEVGKGATFFFCV